MADDSRTPATFRGITVPARLANRRTELEYAMWEDAVVSILHTVVPLLEEFEDDEPCTPDHNGECQTHGFAGAPCPVAEIAKFLDLARNDERVWVWTTDGKPLTWCYQHRPRGFNLSIKNLVSPDSLAEYPGRLRCVQCGRELISRGT